MAGFNRQYQVSAKPGESTQDVLNRHFKPTIGQRIGKAAKTVRNVGIGAAKIGLGAAVGGGLLHHVSGGIPAHTLGGAAFGAGVVANRMYNKHKERKVNRMMLHN